MPQISVDGWMFMFLSNKDIVSLCIHSDLSAAIC